MNFRNFLFYCLVCLNSIFLISERPATAVLIELGLHSYYSSEEMELKRLKYLIDPTHKITFDPKFNPFPADCEVLFLGDGFEKKYTSICEKVQTWAPKSTQLYRTDIACPCEKKEENVTFQRIDHKEPLPFFNQQFTTVLLKHGLCHCRCSTYSCGGIKNDHLEITFFLLEVARVLNKKNLNSMAYLHGDHYCLCHHEMKDYYKRWEAAAVFVKDAYPNLRIRLVHHLNKGSESELKSALSLGASPEDLASQFLGITIQVEK